MATDETQYCVLTINGGSSSVKYAAYTPGEPPVRVMRGEVEHVGDAGAAAVAVMASLRQRLGQTRVVGIGHRVVHGGPRLLEHQRITPDVIAELRRIERIDLPHLPGEIALIEAMADAFAGVPQVACFDTAFHRDMPRVAQLLPIPRQFDETGVRRFGFHGLSYTFLMEELARVAGAKAANGRIILAHLGNGASMAAVRNGQAIDTTMGFTPMAGLVMGTRPGDLDPGLLAYLVREERLGADELDELISKRCGMIGVSETSSDMRDLIARRPNDTRAAEAVELFCYSARKWIGALTAAMGGLNTLIFSGGIGEHSADVRAEICTGLEFLGVHVDPARNAAAASVISADGAHVAVRVIATDEEIVIARTICGTLGFVRS